ncbi:MAG: hypothetical protein AB4352_22790 [Hormoscilla sp.]
MANGEWLNAIGLPDGTGTGDRENQWYLQMTGEARGNWEGEV